MFCEEIKLRVYKCIKSYFYSNNLISFVFNVSYFNRSNIFKEVSRFAKENRIGNEVLDVGCGESPYKHLFDKHKYTGLDIELSGHAGVNMAADIYYDGKEFPLVSNSFDAVICTEVITHSFDQDLLINEILRVTKPQGLIFVTTPFLWLENEAPYDNNRFTLFGIVNRFSRLDCEIIYKNKYGNLVELVYQLLLIFLLKRIPFIFLRLCIQILFLPLTLLVSILSFIFDRFWRTEKVVYTGSVLVIRKTR
jgi:ubiquinone/menaquinone biosynthesis C-methylase UbiE